jgi:DNA-binding response OmpR family regulator
MAEVLLVEDDQAVAAAMAYALLDRGHRARTSGTAVEALRAVADQEPDIVILDLGLPDMDGSTVLRMLRGITQIPVIIATARSEERSIVDLLNAGADDYIVKPFSGDQLAARITALLRRVKGGNDGAATLEVGDLTIDLPRRTVSFRGAELVLTRREFDLLAYLAARAGVVVTRRELIQAVWQQRYTAGDDQTLDVHVSWLRRKLGETAAHPVYLHTVRGVGLKLTKPE